jgi:hypothetical protein
VKTVNILRGIDGFKDAPGVDLRRERKLNQDAVNGVVFVQVVDESKQFVGCDRGGRRVHPARESNLFARADLGFDVELRGWILTNKDCGEARTDPHGDQALNFFAKPREHLIADFCAVENACRHLGSLSFVMGAKTKNNTRRKPGDSEAACQMGSHDEGLPNRPGREDTTRTKNSQKAHPARRDGQRFGVLGLGGLSVFC